MEKENELARKEREINLKAEQMKQKKLLLNSIGMSISEQEEMKDGKLYRSDGIEKGKKIKPKYFGNQRSSNGSLKKHTMLIEDQSNS